MRFSHLASIFAAITLLLASSTTTQATLHTYYQEEFNNGGTNMGIFGPIPPNPDTYSNSSFSVDGSAGNGAGGASFPNGGNSFAITNGDTGNQFKFRGLDGSVVFETAAAAILVGNPANFTALNMTMNVLIQNAILGDSVTVEGFLDGNSLGAFNYTADGGYAPSYDLSDFSPYLTPNTLQNFVVRVTATQASGSIATFTIDNILVQGNSTPEPASMSLMGMGLLAMCGAGYRRRKKTPALEA